MIYFLYGDEDFIIQNKINELKKRLDKNIRDINFKTYDNPQYVDFVSLIRTQGAMFGKMLIVIEIFDLLKSSLDDKQIKEISNALENNNDSADIVLTAKIPRDSGEKVDKRKKLFKTLSKYNCEECLTIPPYKTADLSLWIKGFAKDKNLKISQEAIDLLIARVGNNLWLLNSEMEKIRVYLYPKNIVEKSVIEEICVNNDDIFAFSDFVMKNEIDKALLEYKKLLDTTYPLVILANLQKNVRTWITLKAKASKLSEFELSKLVGMHEYRVKLTLQKLKNVDLKRLVRLKKNLTEAEYRIKAGLSQDVEDEVKYAFVR